MKKNILIIGFGDIGERLCLQMKNDKYQFYPISRGNFRSDLKIYIKWDWLSKKIPKLEHKEYDSIVFIPKPSSFDAIGYDEGFIHSSDNVFRLCKELSYKKFITISSTRVYGTDKSGIYNESHPLEKDDFRCKSLINYEQNQVKNYGNKLIILRFSGLYNSIADRKSINYLHRDNAACIIRFFIRNDFKSETHQIFNCSEDRNDGLGNISNSKLKKLGFIFNDFD